MKKLLLFTTILFSSTCIVLNAQNIYTVAGNGYFNYTGDGAQAKAGQLNSAYAVALDDSGNMYVADQGNNCIRKINSAGIITTFAGTGVAGYTGEKYAATASKLNQPDGVAVDAAGNVYISDAGNNRIRQVSKKGIMITVAGNGKPGFKGDGLPADSAEIYQPAGIYSDAAGDIYIADLGNNRVRLVSAGVISTIAGIGTNGYSGNGAPAVDAKLSKPSGLAIDGSGNVYICDQGNNCIRMVNNTGIIITFAGNDSIGYSGDGGSAIHARLNKPSGVYADGLGNVYIADMGNNRLRVVNKSKIINTLAGDGFANYIGDGGPATASELNAPTAVITDDTGNVYIADNKNDVIRKIDTTGTISTIIGDGTGGYSGNNDVCTNASLGFVDGVYRDGAGNMFITNQYDNTVRKINTSGIITTIAGNGVAGFSGDGGPATAAMLDKPSGVTTDASGAVYIVDHNNSRIRMVDTTSGLISTIAGTGTLGYSGDGGPASSAQIKYPYGIATDATGNIYFTDTYNSCIRKINTSGIISTIAGNGTQGYNGDKMLATAAELNRPEGITIDGAGDIYLVDNYQVLVRKINKNDSIFTVAGNRLLGYRGDGGKADTAEFEYPVDVAVDKAGHIYVSDQGNNCIRVINSSGYIHTSCGSAKAGYSGDAGAASLAKLNQPSGIFVDALSNMYIADYGNSCIREIKNVVITGVNDVKPSTTVNARVYPNPSSGVFTVEVNSDPDSYRKGLVNSIVEVYNMLGEKVYSTTLSTVNSQLSIDLTGKPAGVYMYRIISESGDMVSIGKLVKE